MLGLQALFFYIFAFVTIGSALMVVFLRNPVHSVLFLILAFVSGAGLFLLAGAEFLALILIVVYVGAVAILFLFVVMMLDIDIAQVRGRMLEYAPIGALVGLVLLAEIIIAVTGNYYDPGTPLVTSQPIPPLETVSNIQALGSVLYTRYVFFFQVSGMILLVAMIGAIVLTLRHREGIKRQSVSEQVSHTGKNSIEVRKVESGKGI
ncbi:NADH-quinone oxidoreductase subunit J [Consotaella salsifontis]|uniref:NADH-quinone oxidoreductase subunit J n=1 Tax=Consotaella salsifontis TaxID=1365950 RepID=A0A1T4LLU5_9HYPH|nr:NADH-quinone oxidoreductase subunit J [Consotaella salsifontis]SJZ55703.1 NADH dehydrogenase subunit J [Consotaella salsifontis]